MNAPAYLIVDGGLGLLIDLLVLVIVICLLVYVVKRLLP